MKNQYEKAKEKYGEVTCDGLTVALTQDAYCAGDDDYRASAVDTAGNEYVVFWEETEAYRQASAQYSRREQLRYDITHWSSSAEELDQAEAELEHLETLDLDWVEDLDQACDWDHPIDIRDI